MLLHFSVLLFVLQLFYNQHYLQLYFQHSNQVVHNYLIPMNIQFHHLKQLNHGMNLLKFVLYFLYLFHFHLEHTQEHQMNLLYYYPIGHMYFDPMLKLFHHLLKQLQNFHLPKFVLCCSIFLHHLLLKLD